MATERLPAQLTEAEQALAMPAADENWRHPREGAAIRPVHWGRVQMVDLTPGEMRLRSRSPRDGTLEIEVPNALCGVLKTVLDEPVEVRYDEYSQNDGSVRLIAWVLRIVDAAIVDATGAEVEDWREAVRAQGADPDDDGQDWLDVLLNAPQTPERRRELGEALLRIDAERG